MEVSAITPCLEKAHAYTAVHGNGLMRTLVAFAAGKTSRDEALACLGAFQLADGGWWGIGTLKAHLSTITNTINGLHWLRMLDGFDSPSLDRTLDFLHRLQRADGAWDEVEEIRQQGARSWMVPGIYANQLWYTAAICRYLIEFDREDSVDFKAALKFLRQGWDGKQFPDYPHTHWMALCIFSKLPKEEDLGRQIAAGSLQFLLKFSAQQKINAGEVGEIGYAALVAGDTSAKLLGQVYSRLLEEQDETGFWDFADGDTTDRVMNTAKIAAFLRMIQIAPKAAPN